MGRGRGPCACQVRPTCAIIPSVTTSSAVSGKRTAHTIPLGWRRRGKRPACMHERKPIMEERSNDEVIYYYDLHPTEEDLLGESNPHLDLITYLVTLLRYLFRDQPYAVYGNLNFYQTRNPHELPLVPDVAVIKGGAYDPFATSWKVGQDGPAPQVVFELLSKGTWERDLTEKPLAYAHMGVQEYFAYDPHKRPLAPATAQRLFGWRLNPREGTMRPLSLRQRGSLWSV